jgi:hypothetical protein
MAPDQRGNGGRPPCAGCPTAVFPTPRWPPGGGGQVRQALRHQLPPRARASPRHRSVVGAELRRGRQPGKADPAPRPETGPCQRSGRGIPVCLGTALAPITREGQGGSDGAVFGSLPAQVPLTYSAAAKTPTVARWALIRWSVAVTQARSRSVAWPSHKRHSPQATPTDAMASPTRNYRE